MLLTSPWIAGLLALFAWWISTGAILVAVRLGDQKGHQKALTVGTLPVLAIGFWGITATSETLAPFAVYGAAASALAIWGWIELAFLTGVITGPNRLPLKGDEPEWERFVRAWGTVAYHEITLTFAVSTLALMTLGQPNRFGFWVFAILYAARISAKLNLYLGVRKVNTAFLPRNLGHLPSHFRIARINWLFPTSVTLLTFATACWLERVADATTPASAVGFALLAALSALALLEHWFMVVRLPDEKLWQWMLPKTPGEDRNAL